MKVPAVHDMMGVTRCRKSIKGRDHEGELVAVEGLRIQVGEELDLLALGVQVEREVHGARTSTQDAPPTKEGKALPNHHGAGAPFRPCISSKR